jgi:hypothetical protein
MPADENVQTFPSEAGGRWREATDEGQPLHPPINPVIINRVGEFFEIHVGD